MMLLSSFYPIPRLPHSCLLPASATITTGSSAHLGVPRLRPSIPKTHLPPFSHPSLPKADSSSPPSSPPRLSDSRHRRSKIYYDFICSKYRVLHFGITSFGYFDIIIYHLLYVCFFYHQDNFPNDPLSSLSLNLASMYH